MGNTDSKLIPSEWRQLPLWLAPVLLLVVSVLVFLLVKYLEPPAPPSELKRTVSVIDSAFEGWSVTPIEVIPGLDPNKVDLGRRLFHDPKLSRDQSISCASCHPLDRGGADGRSRSIGIGGAIGRRNAPTVLNAALAFRQFWDGRAETLEAQVDGPIHDPGEMGSSWPEIIARLRADTDYPSQFRTLYGDISIGAIRNAIASFEQSLVTPGGRFDRYLRGETNAITARELAGWQAFKHYGCVSCHQGALLGGNMFEKIGVAAQLPAGTSLENDLGRYLLTGQEPHRNEFKVPSLRNVELTAPYFHDGSVATLDEAVRIMAISQLGIRLPDEDHQSILAFLRTLTAPVAGPSR